MTDHEQVRAAFETRIESIACNEAAMDACWSIVKGDLGVERKINALAYVLGIQPEDVPVVLVRVGFGPQNRGTMGLLCHILTTAGRRGRGLPDRTGSARRPKR